MLFSRDQDVRSLSLLKKDDARKVGSAQHHHPQEETKLEETKTPIRSQCGSSLSSNHTMKLSVVTVVAFLWIVSTNGIVASSSDKLQDLSFQRSHYTRSRRVHGMKGKKQEVELCSSSGSIGKTLLRGAFLRVASDLSGGTAFESVKTRVTLSKEGPLEAARNIIQESDNGFFGLWRGSSSRMVEGSLVGGVFLLGSSLVKNQVLSLGGAKPLAALAGGISGGMAQALVMTPAGLVFTSLNYNRNRKGYESDTALSVARRTLQEKGLGGMYKGFTPMCLRQASNWASRATFTEIIRSSLGKYGVIGELASGAFGGVLSCWNTPVETARVWSQRDASMNLPTKTILGYWDEIIERDGFCGLYRGVTPRAFQAIWQTCFLVVVPNLLGF